MRYVEGCTLSYKQYFFNTAVKQKQKHGKSAFLEGVERHWRKHSCGGGPSRVHFAVGPLWRPVAFGKGHELQHVEGIFPAMNVLLYILDPTAFSGDQKKKKDEEE